MDLKYFLRSIEVPGLTGLITSDEDTMLKTRDGIPAHVSFAYSPKRVKSDINIYELREIPEDPNILSQFRRYIEGYVIDCKPDNANAFHLSHPVFWKTNNGPFTDLEYTISFFVIREEID